jgi:hypothetical protein
MVGLPRKLSSFLQPIKDDPILKMPSVYSIPCKCGEVHIGQTGGLTDILVKKLHHHIYLYHLKEPVVAEHSIN